MRIMGIDPGLATMGWGIIDGGATAADFVSSGIIQTLPEDALPIRLKQIDQGIETLIELYRPDVIVFEQAVLCQECDHRLHPWARPGVLRSPAAPDIPESLYEYTPMQIKQAVTGYGKAEKQQIQRMTQLMLKLPDIIRPDDAADAVAAALTHYQSGRFGDLHIMK